MPYDHAPSIPLRTHASENDAPKSQPMEMTGGIEVTEAERQQVVAGLRALGFQTKEAESVPHCCGGRILYPAFFAFCLLIWVCAFGFMAGLIVEATRNDDGLDRSITDQNLTIWSYVGFTNPDVWYNVEDHQDEYGVCRNGTAQSPIEINPLASYMINVADGDTIGTLVNYPADPVAFTLTFNDIGIPLYTCQTPPDCGTITLNGATTPLHSLLIHTTAEHVVSGLRLPIELQLLHQPDSATTHTAALAIFYVPESSPPADNSTHPIDNMVDLAIVAAARGLSAVSASFAVAEMVNPASGFYAYNGSMTTPPCTEGVAWAIQKQSMLSAPGMRDDYFGFIAYPGNYIGSL